MPDIIRTKDFASDAAGFIAQKIRASLEADKACVLCLAGGKTPMPVYEKLAGMDLNWPHIYIAFGDERNVPSTDKESNYKAAHDSLLAKAPIPKDNILRIETELGLNKAAQAYEDSLLDLQKKLGRDHLFDIMLLGIGGDGHTASLFPNTTALAMTNKLVTGNKVPQLNTNRITLTYPAINASKSIVFLVNDPSKKDILEKIWAGNDLPAAQVKPINGKIAWVIGE